MMYKLGWINWARLIIWLLIGMVVYLCIPAITAGCKLCSWRFQTGAVHGGLSEWEASVAPHP